MYTLPHRFFIGAAAPLTALLLLSGCASLRQGTNKQPAAKPAKTSTKASPAQASSPAAQKEAYDRGLKLYTQEKYKEARKAWQEAVKLGPGTPLGKKSQEYLQNVEKTIQTLEGLQ